MEHLIVNPSVSIGKIKPMHAVNNGPHHKDYGGQQNSNLKEYSELCIPYARNHDASFYNIYGGEHTVDVHAIFPDFSKDPYSPESYDFIITDHYLKTIEKAGAKVFYRLGSKIEHEIKKYGTLPPPDFKKWAVICEHIIRHYTEGWADGFNMDIEYWEIWNEPDLDPDDSADKRTWGGTSEEFYDFYIIASKHLKSCFPHLKIGGPAVSSPLREPWNTNFLERIKAADAPLDFFSWHIYARDPEFVAECARTVRERLDKFGFTDVETNLNEWNYVRGWTDDFKYTLEQIKKIKGAAFASAVMTLCQNSPVDMLMYYDARPCGFNGLFETETLGCLKSYYAFKAFSKLYKAGTQIEITGEIENIYTLAAKDDENVFTLLTYYTEDDDMNDEREFEVQLPGGNHKIYLLDEEHDEDCIMKFTGTAVTLAMKPNSLILIQSK